MNDNKPEIPRDAQPKRMKYWRELDEAGKVERMREVIRSLQSSNQFLETQVSNLLKHSHLDGLLVSPIQTSFGYSVQGEDASTKTGDVYF